MKVTFMKFKLFLAILGALASGPVVALSQEPVETENSPEKQLSKEEIDALFFKHQELIFGAKNNYFCKPKDPFCPSQCHYEASTGYNHFIGAHNPWSLIPDLLFKDEKELNAWACSQTKDTYLIAHRPGCPPCAKLLAALETRAQNLRETNINIYKINFHENDNALFNKDWNLEATPTVWKISKNIISKRERLDPRDYYKTFINIRSENKIPKTPVEYIKANISIKLNQIYNHSLGYFKHNEKFTAEPLYRLKTNHIKFDNNFILEQENNETEEVVLSKPNPTHKIDDLDQNNVQPKSKLNNNYSFGYFKHDEKVAAAAVCAALCYGGYKGYGFIKNWYNNRYKNDKI